MTETQVLEERIVLLEKELKKYKEWTTFKRSQDALYTEILDNLMEANRKRVDVLMGALSAYHRGYLTGEGKSSNEGYEKTIAFMEEMKLESLDRY